MRAVGADVKKNLGKQNVNWRARLALLPFAITGGLLAGITAPWGLLAALLVLGVAVAWDATRRRRDRT